MAQALVVPIIALVGVWIAARQMLIADEKLQLDAFDRQYERRVAVYEVTREILQSVFLQNIIPSGEIKAYGFHTLDAQFLFDEAMYKYLREILQRITTHNLARSELAKIENENLSLSDEKKVWEKMRGEQLQWIIQQGDEVSGFAIRFLPFLVHKQVKRPWLLRWP